MINPYGEGEVWGRCVLYTNVIVHFNIFAGQIDDIPNFVILS